MSVLGWGRATAIGAATMAAALAVAAGAHAIAVHPAAPGSPGQQIEDAERAFVQAVAQSGIAPGFRQFAAPDAVMFLPDPTFAIPALDHAHWAGELLWRPQYVGVAPSGDMAFSVGPSLAKAVGKASGGYYLSIWKRGPDGVWKFAVDHGVDMPASIFAGPVQPATVLALDAPTSPRSPEAIREADGALNVALVKSASAAFAARMDDQAIVVRTNRPVAVGRKKAVALASEAPGVQEAYTLNGAVSSDGNLGYTYGRARWSTPSGPQMAYYVRVWRSGPQGWRLLVDHLAER